MTAVLPMVQRVAMPSPHAYAVGCGCAACAAERAPRELAAPLALVPCVCAKAPCVCANGKAVLDPMWWLKGQPKRRRAKR